MLAFGTHYGPYRIQATPKERLRSRHYETLSSPQLPLERADTTDDYGLDGAIGGWELPPLPQGPQDSGTTAGRMERPE